MKSIRLWGAEIDLVLYGTKEQRVLGKRRLSAAYARLKKTDPREAAYLKDILRRIKV